MILSKPSIWDIIYKVSGLTINSYIIVSIQNNLDYWMLLLDLKSQEWSDTDKLIKLFRAWKNNTKEYIKLIDGYKNLYTNFYWRNYCLFWDKSYFSKLKDAREEIKLNKIKEIEKK